MPALSKPSPLGRSQRIARLRRPILAVAAVTLAFGFADLAKAQTGSSDADPDTVQAIQDMDLAQMEDILTALDPEMERAGGAFRLTVEDVPVLVITDARADRMRAMIPIRSAEGLSDDDMIRMMQANFDSALDARYAIAEGRVWSVFIHPLRALRREQLISGIGQTVNTAVTYGSLFSSGAGQFGRGDSAGEQRKLLERLQDKGQDI